MDNCPIHHTPWKTIPGGISKKTLKPYNSFQVCSTFGCKEKPQSVPLDLSDPIDAAISKSPTDYSTNKKMETVAEVKPDWDEIAKGKVRHGVAVAVIGQIGLVELTDEMTELMEQWVDWIIGDK